MHQKHIASNGVQYYTFQQFCDKPLVSLFTTRHGGVSLNCYDSLNFGFSSGDQPENVLENYKRLAQCFGTDIEHMVVSAQTHTANVRMVTKKDGGKGILYPKDYQDIDGLITNEPNLVLITAHADCNPVQFYDPVQNVIGVAHSGWMGTLKNISHEMLTLMFNHYHCNPADILVSIGPALCQTCFEVDFDVAKRFSDTCEAYQPYISYTEKKAYIHLKGILTEQLKKDGILPSHIEISHLCTKCHPEEFFSHRVVGTHRGVMVSAMMLKN